MKNILKLVLISSMVLFLSGCDSSIDRVERTFTLLQENITKIVNELTEIQLIESYVQTDFETTLKASEDLSAFLAKDSAIQQNIDKRAEHLTKLSELVDELDKLNEEISNQTYKDEMIKNQVTAIQSQIAPLSADLKVYIEDYQASLEPESLTYKSIANPKTDYDSFFKVFDNVNTLNLTNQINLEKVLGYFEGINAKLIDFKVYLTTLKE